MGLLTATQANITSNKGGLLSRAPIFPLETPKNLPGAELRASPLTFTQKLYQELPTPIQKGVDITREALFGFEKERGAGLTKDIPLVASLKAEGFLPFLGRTDFEKVDIREKALTEKGVEPERASAIAFYDVLKGGMTPKTEAAKQKYEELKVTPEEEDALNLPRFTQSLGSLADAGQFLPIGLISKTRLPKILESLVKETDPKIVTNILKKEFPKLTKIEEIAPIISKATTPEEVSSIIKGTGAITERGFIQSAKEVIPQANKIGGQYVPRLTDELAIKAKNLIRDDIVTAERVALTQADDNAVAVASELLKKYGDDAAKAVDPAVSSALYDKAAELANTIAPKLTEQGRAIQAASILGRLTPEGQIRFAAREIQRYNETAKIKIPELTGEQAKFIGDEMKAIQGLAGEERAMRFQKLQDYVKNLVPTPLWKKVIAIWKAGLLTGIKTSGLNLFSNISHFTTEVIKDIPASIVDSVASLFTGRRAKTFNLRGTGKGLREGFNKGIRYFKTGFDERNIAQKLDYHKVNFGKGKVAKAFQVYTDTVFRAMGSADQPFYYGTLARSLGDQAQAIGINKGLRGKALKEFAETLIQDPTEEMIRYATADAATAVFQNETYLGKAAKAIQNIPIVGEIVVPFGRTPSSVATQIVNYTPVGTVVEIIKQIANKKFDQRLFSEAVGRGLTGTAVLYIGWELFKKGLTSLDRPTTEREQKLWELEGRKANSIYINGKWRSPIVLGPAGNLLLVGGHFGRAFQDSGSPTAALSNAMVGSGKSFTEQTFLTGINQAVGALNDPERYATNYLGQMTASIIPTLVSDVARANDPLERRAETTPQRIQARIPGARRGLEPQVDVLGRERESVGNPLEIMIDPTRPSPDMSNSIIRELRRLTTAGFEVSPTLLGDKKGYGVLTQEGNTRLWKRAGEIITGKLESLFSKENYPNLSDDKKGELIEMVIDKSKINARAEAVIELTQGLSGEGLKKKLSELKDGKLLTRDVYNKYIELR